MTNGMFLGIEVPVQEKWSTPEKKLLHVSDKVRGGNFFSYRRKPSGSIDHLLIEKCALQLAVARFFLSRSHMPLLSKEQNITAHY